MSGAAVSEVYRHRARASVGRTTAAIDRHAPAFNDLALRACGRARELGLLAYSADQRIPPCFHGRHQRSSARPQSTRRAVAAAPRSSSSSSSSRRCFRATSPDIFPGHFPPGPEKLKKSALKTHYPDQCPCLSFVSKLVELAASSRFVDHCELNHQHTGGFIQPKLRS